MAILQVRGAREALPEQLLRNVLVLGPERTFQQDPKYSIRMLVDVAIRALSPAINNLRTTVQSLNQIEDCREISKEDRQGLVIPRQKRL